MKIQLLILLCVLAYASAWFPFYPENKPARIHSPFWGWMGKLGNSGYSFRGFGMCPRGYVKGPASICVKCPEEAVDCYG